MERLVEFLVDQPLLVLFVVIGAGYFLGSASIFRFSLGPAAVLFTGIVIGAIDPRLRIPEFIPSLGLILSTQPAYSPVPSFLIPSGSAQSAPILPSSVCFWPPLRSLRWRLDLMAYRAGADRRNLYRIVDQHSGAGKQY
jgi:hypothetical protein